MTFLVLDKLNLQLPQLLLLFGLSTMPYWPGPMSNSNVLLSGKRLPVQPNAPLPLFVDLYGVAILFGVDADLIQASRSGEETVVGLNKRPVMLLRFEYVGNWRDLFNRS